MVAQGKMDAHEEEAHKDSLYLGDRIFQVALFLFFKDFFFISPPCVRMLVDTALCGVIVRRHIFLHNSLLHRK